MQEKKRWHKPLDTMLKFAWHQLKPLHDYLLLPSLSPKQVSEEYDHEYEDLHIIIKTIITVYKNK